MRRHRPFPPGRGLLALLALLPAACADPGPSLQEQALAEALAANRASLEALNPDGSAPAAARPGGTEAGLAAPASAARLRDAPASVVTGWFGPPQRRRVEGDAEIWLYQGSNCFLDLVLYREAGSLRVADATARAAGLGRATEGDCLRGLARRPPGPG
jgi:hypothetical protein